MRSCKVSISGQVYHICRRNGIGESGRPRPTVSKHPRPLCLTVRSAKQRRSLPSAGLALSGASRQLPQSGSPWQRRKVSAQRLRLPLRQQGVKYKPGSFADCQGLSLWERWHREAMTERASPLTAAQGLCFADAFGRERADPAQGLCPKPTKPTVVFCARCF